MQFCINLRHVRCNIHMWDEMCIALITQPHPRLHIFEAKCSTFGVQCTCVHVILSHVRRQGCKFSKYTVACFLELAWCNGTRLLVLHKVRESSEL